MKSDIAGHCKLFSFDSRGCLGYELRRTRGVTYEVDKEAVLCWSSRQDIGIGSHLSSLVFLILTNKSPGDIHPVLLHVGKSSSTLFFVPHPASDPLVSTWEMYPESSHVTAPTATTCPVSALLPCVDAMTSSLVSASSLTSQSLFSTVFRALGLKYTLDNDVLCPQPSGKSSPTQSHQMSHRAYSLILTVPSSLLTPCSHHFPVTITSSPLLSRAHLKGLQPARARQTWLWQALPSSSVLSSLLKTLRLHS